MRSSQSKKERAPRRPKATAGNEEDIADHLLSAVTGGGSGRDRILRKVFRSAVENQYESSKAVARAASLSNQSYSIATHASTSTLTSPTELPCLKVLFPPVGRGKNHEDVVDLIAPDMISRVLHLAISDEDCQGREVLKVENLSRVSPRIFWSIVHAHGPDILTAMKFLLPEVGDWGWYTERKRALSEKAQNNLEIQASAPLASAPALKASSSRSSSSKGKKRAKNDSRKSTDAAYDVQDVEHSIMTVLTVRDIEIDDQVEKAAFQRAMQDIDNPILLLANAELGAIEEEEDDGGDLAVSCFEQPALPMNPLPRGTSKHRKCSISQYGGDYAGEVLV